MRLGEIIGEIIAALCGAALVMFALYCFFVL